MAKKKYYVVWNGRKPGVYESWEECKKQIENFEGAKYKSFMNEELAYKALEGSWHEYIGRDLRIEERTEEDKARYGDPLLISISVDAACSGNPGTMEYRGVDTASGKVLFHEGPFYNSTVNIGEFLAIVHGLSYLKKQNSNKPIYSDSRTAMKWVRDKQVKTTLKPMSNNEKTFKWIRRAEQWLASNSWKNDLLKWETKVWGEIPADFGRK